MELESSYQLLGMLRDDGIRTYGAIEIATGQEAQVHLFAEPESEPDQTLFNAIRALPVSKRREILEIGIDEEMPYVVTQKLPAATTARDWLMGVSGAGAKLDDSVFLAGSWKAGTPIPDELLRMQRQASGSRGAPATSTAQGKEQGVAADPPAQPPMQPPSEESSGLFQEMTPSATPTLVEKKSMLPIYVAGGALLLAIVLIILFFVQGH